MPFEWPISLCQQAGVLTSTDNIGEIDRRKDPFYKFNESSFMKIHLTSSLNLLMK